MRSVSRLIRSHATATCYVALLAVAETVYNLLGRDDARSIHDWANTNVGNLHDHPAGALLVSAFVVASYPVAWLVLAAMGLLSSDSLLGWRGTAAIALVAHVGGTLLSEGIVQWRVDHGRMPSSAMWLDDVGSSYVVVAALTTALCFGWMGSARSSLRVLRPVVGIVGLFALRDSLFTGLTKLEVTAVGHTFSMATSVVVGGLLYWRRSVSAADRLEIAGDLVRR